MLFTKPPLWFPYQRRPSIKDPLLKECIQSSDWLKTFVHKGSFIFSLLLYFLLSMFIIRKDWCYDVFSIALKMIFRYRVQFKIGLITYKILNQGQPVYLRELIHPYTSFRNTRRNTPKLKFLEVHTPTFDRRFHKSIKHFSNSFSHYAPVLWNSLPFHIRNSPSVASFRKHLKTHLFNSSFPT